MNRFFIRGLLLMWISLVSACSLPPEVPVTRENLEQTKIYRRYIIEESPEEVLDALNKEGEVILEGKLRIRGKDFPVYIKILATPTGLDVSDYDR